MVLIYKIVPRTDWEAVGNVFAGSAVDQRDGFMHFSTGSQLAETLRLYFAGQDDLVLIAVAENAVAADLRYEFAPARGEDFPHLFASLPRSAVVWARSIVKRGDGAFVLPALD